MSVIPRTARIRAACPACGDVDLAVEQMWLVRLDPPGQDHYAFRCSGCDLQVRRPANDAVVRVLERLVPVDDNRLRAPRVVTL